MKSNIYADIKNKVLELNRINDEVSLFEWNKDDGPKFDSVEEMKEFEERVLNGDLDYLISYDSDFIHSDIDCVVNTFKHSINDYTFYIYTYKKNDDYITYMSIQYLDDDDTINNIYGYKTSDKEKSDSYVEKLKDDITSNTLDYIFTNIKVDVENNIKNIKRKYDEWTSASQSFYYAFLKGVKLQIE